MYCQYSSRSQPGHCNKFATAAFCDTPASGSAGTREHCWENHVGDQWPAFPVHDKCQSARINIQNRIGQYNQWYTRLAVRNHWSRVTRLVLNGTIWVVGEATYASAVHGPYNKERRARCDSTTRVKIPRHGYKALPAATSRKGWERDAASDVGYSEGPRNTRPWHQRSPPTSPCWPLTAGGDQLLGLFRMQAPTVAHLRGRTAHFSFVQESRWLRRRTPTY